MKEKKLNKWNLSLVIFISAITIFNMFGFNVSPAITESRYELDKVVLQNQLKDLEREIAQNLENTRKAFCFALAAKIEYLENEKFKYNHADEIAIEARQVGSYLENSKNAARSLMMVSQQLGKLKKLAEKEGC